MSTASWLRELGAKPPREPVRGYHVLVLGKWKDGYYPIEWKRQRLNRIFANMTSDEWINSTEHIRESWTVFGIPTARPLTREDCERILKAVDGE